MPTFELQGSDGKTYEVEAPSAEAAVGAFQQFTPQPAEQSMGWGDVATSAVKNVPASAQRFGESIVHAVSHPIDTVSSLADVGYGGLSKAAGAVGVPMDPEAKSKREGSFDAVTEFFKDRYGGVENLKKTIAEDPVGFAADLSTVLTGGGGLAARAPGVAGKVGQIVGKVGSTIDPLSAAAKGVKAVAGNVVAPVIGMATGVGAEPVRAAAKAGFEGNTKFAEGMRGQGGINDTLDMADSAVSAMGKERSAAYTADMAAVKGSQAKLNFAPVANAVNSARQKTSFHGVPMDEVATKTLEEINSKIDEFRNMGSLAYRTPEGMDALKRSIGEIRQRAQPGTLSRNVADEVYNSIKNEIVRQVPEYAKAMKGYSEASDKINDIRKTFSISERAAPDTTARKLQSVMRNNVNTNYGRRTKLMDELAKYEPDLPALLAGQTMSSVTPRGLQGLGATGAGIGAITHMNPYALAALPFMSPRLMGEAAYAGGRGVGAVKSLWDQTGIDPSIIAESLFALRGAGEADQALRGGSGPRYEDGRPRNQ